MGQPVERHRTMPEVTSEVTISGIIPNIVGESSSRQEVYRPGDRSEVTLSLGFVPEEIEIVATPPNKRCKTCRRPVVLVVLLLLLLVVGAIVALVVVLTRPDSSPAPAEEEEMEKALVTVVLQLDSNPQETGWDITCQSQPIKNVLIGSYRNPNALRRVLVTVVKNEICILTVFDAAGNGINGGYAEVYFGAVNGNTRATPIPLLHLSGNFGFETSGFFRAVPPQDNEPTPPPNSNPTLRPTAPQSSPQPTPQFTPFPTFPGPPTTLPPTSEGTAESTPPSNSVETLPPASPTTPSEPSSTQVPVTPFPTSPPEDPSTPPPTETPVTFPSTPPPSPTFPPEDPDISTPTPTETPATLPSTPPDTPSTRPPTPRPTTVPPTQSPGNPTPPPSTPNSTPRPTPPPPTLPPTQPPTRPPTRPPTLPPSTLLPTPAPPTPPPTVLMTPPPTHPSGFLLLTFPNMRTGLCLSWNDYDGPDGLEYSIETSADCDNTEEATWEFHVQDEFAESGWLRVQDDQCLTAVYPGDNNGRSYPVDLETCQEDFEFQQWRLTPTQVVGEHQIRNVGVDKCLDVCAQCDTPTVVAGKCEETNVDQMFAIGPRPDYQLKFENSHSGLCLSWSDVKVPDGLEYSIETGVSCGSDDRNRWEFRVEDMFGDEGWLQTKLDNGSFECLVAVRGNTLDLAPCEVDDFRHWGLYPTGNAGEYHIRNAGVNKCIDYCKSCPIPTAKLGHCDASNLDQIFTVAIT